MSLRRDPASTRVLVVYKKSQLELYNEHQPGVLESLAQRDETLVRPFHLAHEDNARAIDQVRQEIEDRGPTRLGAEHDP